MEGKKTSNFLLKDKNIIFSKFYIELIIYFIIIFISTIINLAIYEKCSQTMIFSFSLVVMIFTCLALYALGYNSAENRFGLNKLFPSIMIVLIYLIIWIMSSICKNSYEISKFSHYIVNIDKMFLMIHTYIFNLFNLKFNIEIPSRLFVFVTPFIVYLGNRKNKINKSRKRKEQKTKSKKEENLDYGNI